MRIIFLLKINYLKKNLKNEINRWTDFNLETILDITKNDYIFIYTYDNSLKKYEYYIIKTIKSYKPLIDYFEYLDCSKNVYFNRIINI